MTGPISDDDLGFGGSSQGTEPNYLASLGRISGKALADNLVRNGVDLEVSNNGVGTSLLYLDVTNKRIGVAKGLPDSGIALQVVGSGKIDEDFKVNGTSAKISNIIFQTNGTVTTQVGPINIVPSGPNPYVTYGKVLSDSLEINDNYIRAMVTNQPIELSASGTGIVEIQSSILSSTAVNGNVEVIGNIESNGNVQLNGQFIVGDTIFDTVEVKTDFTQSIIPGDNNLYDFGTNTKRWANVYFNNIPGVQNVNASNVYIGETLFSGNQITSVLSNSDIIFNTSGTGVIDLENFKINGSTITNTVRNSIIDLNSTGTGYWQINGTNAIQIPSGSDGQRPFSEIGETRWNRDRGYLECFDGNVYLVATGGGAVVTEALMEEFGDLYALMLG
jgi:hypothetical protein